jgi:acetyl-CoA carboxylase biotin carboxylase subunit
MFEKVLIANRGEIACRIIRTCRKLGIKTVAVFSEADVDALHVRMADEAYFIGPALAVESYLNIVKVIEVAKISGAEAIHPGYGFLSENAAFAVACREAGIKFIGPAPHVLESMGDKIKARYLATKAGVPVITGTDTEVTDRRALKIAKEIGFPLMVKAASGGGGIGMQIVSNVKELDPLIKRARRLADSAFGSASLYFERYLERASHIEVQILADEKNNVVHLWERDCSVQRRNQKVIEVAPSMKLDSKLRESITGYARKLAKQIGYSNAGTMEFLVSTKGEIFFLELNKRLQVEHGISEMITGIDLVEMQLHIAAGGTLPFKQKDIKAKGFAIEARVYAEDPETFLPSPGTITNVSEPAASEFVRIDSCMYSGSEVSVYYDPLLAKVMCWGPTYNDARIRLLDTLDHLIVDGVTTNIPFLRRLLNSEQFIAGNYDTWLVSDILSANGAQSEGVELGSAEDKRLAAAAAVAIFTDRDKRLGYSFETSGRSGMAPWKLHGRIGQLASRSVHRGRRH